MKKLLTLCMMVALCHSSYSQLIGRNAPSFQDDYLQKSRDQKTGAWILLGGGAALTVVGLVSFNRNFEVMGDSESGLGEAILTGVGVAAMAGSIPLFISSARNKQKATQVKAGVQLEPYFRAEPGKTAYPVYPALTVRIGLR